MVKASNQAKDQVLEGFSYLTALKDRGNYGLLRKRAAKMLADTHMAAKEKEKIAELVNRTEPHPLVFWIGLGSVLVAALVATFLAY